MDICVAFFIFNRPELTREVFSRIRFAQPARLFLVADGPRHDVPSDVASCAATRGVVADVDWPCEVVRMYADTNLGCRQRFHTALPLIFDQVESAVVLEDDTVPGPSFFAYCHGLLDRYRDDERVMHIAGTRFSPRDSAGDRDYVFSRFPLDGGWASWRRAWRHFDPALQAWPGLRHEAFLELILARPDSVGHWRRIFDADYRGVLPDVWSFPWWLSCWQQGGLSIHPSVNLISNIGFGEQATNIRDAGHRFARMEVGSLEPALRAPRSFVPDPVNDTFIEDTVFKLGDSRASDAIRAAAADGESERIGAGDGVRTSLQ